MSLRRIFDSSVALTATLATSYQPRWRSRTSSLRPAALFGCSLRHVLGEEPVEAPSSDARQVEISPDRSNTMGSTPACRRVIAAASPHIPAPMISTFATTHLHLWSRTDRQALNRLAQYTPHRGEPFI